MLPSKNFRYEVAFQNGKTCFEKLIKMDTVHLFTVSKYSLYTCDAQTPRRSVIEKKCPQCVVDGHKRPNTEIEGYFALSVLRHSKTARYGNCRWPKIWYTSAAKHYNNLVTISDNRY